MKAHATIVCSFAVVFGFVHYFALEYLVYSAIGCFYQPGCVLPRWHELATDILWFPASALSQATRASLISPHLETQGLVVSTMWGLAFALLGLLFVNSKARRETSSRVV